MMWRVFGNFRRRETDVTAVDVSSTAGCEEADRLLAGRKAEEMFARLNELKKQSVPTRNVDYLRAIYFQRRKRMVAAVQALREELRYFRDNAPARSLLEKLNAPGREEQLPGNDEFRELFNTVRDYTMLGPARLWSLYSLALQVCEENVPGHFVECGVAAGGSSALMAAVISRHSRQPRRVFACDTFAGMPDASKFDTRRGEAADDTGWGKGTCAAPVESLREISRALKVESIVEPVQGLFSETLPTNRERFGEIALLHMDGDWYSSTRDILVNLFDQVVPRGRIQIDDYGFWEGCRRAVTEFETERGLKFELHRIDETGVWMVK